MTESATYEEFINPDTGEKEAKITPALSEVDRLLDEKRRHILTVEEIESADDVLEATEYIPEWGGSVKIRQFSKAKEFELRKAATIGGQVDKERLELLLIFAGVVEPEMTEEHMGMLLAKSQRAVDRVLAKVVAMNAVSKEEADKAVRQFRNEPGA